ncbi:outer dense fiber protein 3-like protein 2 [Leucoraja erinacea]|uniref:outer dense fiber protein 3-like protein 2 n=1 Tax=Leucoraja erinaceus TaxID=7782 RepID=UPI0024559752|nr:outer dense fiber protein 3-like protein 2 [Leucoraja erinacea]
MDNNTEKAYAPIAARERGPGPGRYGLPPAIGFMGHDLTKHMNPAYTFGRKHSGALYYNSCSPGPRYYVDPKITRFGRNGTPSYSMAARVKTCDLSKIPATPGPGAYNPECTPHLNEHRSPAYTMGSRTRYRKLDTVPAPNSYTLPSLMGPKVPTKPSSACFSVTGRTRREDLSKTPGPGRYNRTDPNIYLRKQPAYSMLGRHELPTYYTQKPGPGAHSPEKVTITNPSVPAFSLGMRHSEYVTPLIINMSD